MATASEEVRRQIGAFGVLGAIGGFISDVLEPLAPMSKYLFGFCLAASLMLLVILLLSRSWRSRVLPAGNIYITVPADAAYASVKLTYADDTKSDVVRFDR